MSAQVVVCRHNTSYDEADSYQSVENRTELSQQIRYFCFEITGLAKDALRVVLPVGGTAEAFFRKKKFAELYLQCERTFRISCFLRFQ